MKRLQHNKQHLLQVLVSMSSNGLLVEERGVKAKVHELMTLLLPRRTQNTKKGLADFSEEAVESPLLDKAYIVS
jgi:hypothetical protein